MKTRTTISKRTIERRRADGADFRGTDVSHLLASQTTIIRCRRNGVTWSSIDGTMPFLAADCPFTYESVGPMPPYPPL